MLKTRTWVILIAAAAAVLVALCLALPRLRAPGVTAVISQDGVVIEEIDLSRVKEAYRFTLEAADGGHNVIEVEPGRIRVAEADCPDKICVQRGWAEDGLLPIVCLPHRLVIQLEEAE